MSLSTLAKPPSAGDASAAGDALRVLSAVPRKRRRSIRVATETDDAEGVSVVVPPEAFEMFLAILAQMANGNAVTVVPIHAELTTQQAADLLNVSRPYFIKLLDEGKIPFRLVGTHRRVLMADLVTFKEKDGEEREAAADALVAEAEALGLGY